MQATNEQVLYQQGAATVTNQQVSYKQQIVPLDSIQSVSIVPPVLKRWYGSVALAIGVVLLIVGYIVWNGVLLSPMIGGIALVIAGVAILLTAHNRYVVRLNGASSNLATLEIADEMQARELANAISMAIKR
jgi:hypothetical protein